MSMKFHQELKMTQGLTMTPQLQQAIKMLTLTHTELTQLIAQELVENPLLEEEYQSKHQSQLQEIDQKLSRLEEQNKETSDIGLQDFTGSSKETLDFIGRNDRDTNSEWEGQAETFNPSSSTPYTSSSASTRNHHDGDEGFPNYEEMASKQTNLYDHLEWQLQMSSLSAKEKELGIQIIHNLNEDGYLDISLEELFLGTSLDQANAEMVLHEVQQFDPVGCATRGLQECLLVQAKALSPRLPLVELILKDYFQDIEKKDVAGMAKKLGIPREFVKNALDIITGLNPRPGSLVQSDAVDYITPDIYVYEMGGDFIISLNDEGVPKLRISPFYKDYGADQKKKRGDHADAKAEDYVHEKYKSALWFMKSIQNRQKTILKVTQAIVNYQPEFFRKGAAFLKPMILRDIAQEIGMHESTVSRVTANKYMHTPMGIFELKYFFNTGIGGKNGGIDIAGETLKIKIKALIDRENVRRPLSDQKIVEILEDEGVVVARRTVAKYREVMGIKTSAQRRKE